MANILPPRMYKEFLQVTELTKSPPTMLPLTKSPPTLLPLPMCRDESHLQDILNALRDDDITVMENYYGV